MISLNSGRRVSLVIVKLRGVTEVIAGSECLFNAWFLNGDNRCSMIVYFWNTSVCRKQKKWLDSAAWDQKLILMGLAKLRYRYYALHLVYTHCAVSILKKGDIFWDSGNLSLFSVEDNNVVVLTTSFWQEWVSVDNLTTLGMGYWGMVYYSVEWCWAIALNIYKTVFWWWLSKMFDCQKLNFLWQVARSGWCQMARGGTK